MTISATRSELPIPSAMTDFDSIVCMGQTTWEGDYQKAVVQLMSELAVNKRVLYIDYQYTLKDWAMGVLGKQPMPVRESVRLKNPLTRKPLKNGGEAYVWAPPLMLPINWAPTRLHDFLLRQNIRRLVNGIRKVMQHLNMRQPLVINAFNPVFGLPMLGKLDERGTIYYCFDEITAGSWISRHGSRFEPLYLQRVNAVVTTSEALRQSKAVVQPRTYCVKNGVNFDLFSQANALTKQDPPKNPVVGYLGIADNRIDIDLVEHCVKTMPDVTFQFVGSVTVSAIKTRLSPYPNVEFIPPKQPTELPALLSRMQAAMIPFVRNPHTYTIYPLKVNEYLAAGLPVVSTPFSILTDFDGVIELATTPDDFAKALQRALSDSSTERKNQRIAMARSNSWAHRAREFEAVIEQL